MKKPNKRLVEKAKVLEKYFNNPNNPNKPVNEEPVTHVSIKHVSIKPGHVQARDCSAEDWFK